MDFVEAETTSGILIPALVHSFRLRVRHPALRNVEVRRALNEALDRNTLIADGLRGRGKVADGPIWPEHWAYSNTPGFAFNPDAARLRLDNAGFPVRPAVNGARPSRFSINCMVVNDSRFERLALLMQRQLSDVGVDVQLTPVTIDVFLDRAGKGDFDAFLVEMAGRSLSWVYAFWHSPSANSPTLTNSGYTAGDRILDDIRRAHSDDEIRRGVADLMRVFHDDPPAAFLSWQVTSRAVSKGYDVSSEPDRDILTNVWQWRAAPVVKQASR